MKFRVTYEGDKVKVRAFTNNKKDKVPLARAEWSLKELREDKSKAAALMLELGSKAEKAYRSNRGLSRYTSSKDNK